MSTQQEEVVARDDEIVGHPSAPEVQQDADDDDEIVGEMSAPTATESDTHPIDEKLDEGAYDEEEEVVTEQHPEDEAYFADESCVP